MATAKFKDPSPYVLPLLKPHHTDQAIHRFLDDLNLRQDPKDAERRPVNVALFGLGRAGTFHLPNLAYNPRVKLVYISDDIQERMDACKKYWKLDNAKCVPTEMVDQIFNDPELDAVVIASPTFTHEGLVLKSLAAGKHVMCEKPVAQDIEAARRCYDEARRVGRPLLTAFNKRFDPSISHVRQRVHNGEVGHVQIVKVTTKNCSLAPIEYIKISGGVFVDTVVHDIDMMCWTVGEYPHRVAAIGQANVPEIAAANDFDTVAAIFHFPSGTVGLINLTRNARFGYDQRLEVFGSRGLIAMGNERPMAGVSMQQQDMAGEVFNPIYFNFPSRYKEAYRAEMEHFLDVVQGKEPEFKVKDLETLAVCKVAAACSESARTGKFVTIDWAEGELPN